MRRDVVRTIGAERYEHGRSLAWKTAKGTGTWSPEARDTSYELYCIVDEVLMAAFADEDSSAVRLRKACELYADFPSYTLLSQLRCDPVVYPMSDRDRPRYYRFLGTMVDAAEDELADPATYELWSGAFEDAGLVGSAWSEVTGTIRTAKGVRRLLHASGPVPERVKLPLFDALISDVTFHDAIFDAIARGLFDVYGHVTRETLDAYLPRLRIDESDEVYRAVQKRLADPRPIRTGWRLT